MLTNIETVAFLKKHSNFNWFICMKNMLKLLAINNLASMMDL